MIDNLYLSFNKNFKTLIIISTYSLLMFFEQIQETVWESRNRRNWREKKDQAV